LTAQAPRPLPVEDDDSYPYWQAAREHRLALPRCDDCGKICFPPRARCPACLSDRMTWDDMSGRGSVYSFCTVCVPVVRGVEPPYVVAQVELEEQAGLRVIANILDCPPSDVRIGMAVEVCFEDLDDDIALPQFRPAQPL
jgi:uncharacterized OB-fold protein